MPIPSDLSGLTAWYKADSLALSDGNSVSSWTDSSGNSRTQTQGTGTFQPTYQASRYNGLPVVKSDGSNDVLASTATIANVTTSGVFTIIVAATVATAGTQTTTYNNAAIISDETGFNYIGLHVKNVSSALQVKPYVWDGAEKTITLTNATFGVPFYCTWDNDGTTMRAAINGVAFSTLSAGVPSDRAGKLILFHGKTDYADCQLAEAIVYNRVLTTAERAGIEGYLTARYWGTDIIMPQRIT